MFYANYPDSELIQSTTPPPHAQEHLHFSKQTIFRTSDQYKQGGSYKSPLHDLLALFNTVNIHSKLTIHLILQFKKETSTREKALDITKALLFGNKNTQPKESQENGIEPIESLQGELWMKMGIAISSQDLVTKNAIREQFSLLLKSFLQSGNASFKPVPAPLIPIMRSQISNFFHIPVATNFTKALDYAVYRKLPYPYPLPTAQTTPQEEFTLIGTTDYRNDKIPFGMIEEDKFRHIYIVGKT